MNDGSDRENDATSLGALTTLIDAPRQDRPAIHDGGLALTFAEVVERVGATALPGVFPGARVGIVLPASAEAIVAVFAVWRAGATAVPVNPRLTPAEITSQLARARAVASVRPDPAGTTVLECLKPIYGTDMLQNGQDRRREDVALVLTTSGTTGTPKPVELTHTKVLDGIDIVLRSLRGAGVADGPDPSRAPAPNLVPVPLSLWAGLYQVLFAFRAGNPVVLLDPFSTIAFAEAVATHEVRSTVLAPAMMTALNDDPTIADLHPLRIVRSITAPLSVHQSRRFHERFGATVLNSYGQTELGGEVIGWTAADARAHGNTKLGSVGRPHPGVSAYVLDPDDAGVGELCVRAPSMIAPARPAELSDRLAPAGHLHTGDIGRIDADGFVWLTGRVSDLINRGGMKVWPDDIEEVLRSHPSITDAAVAGMPDERLGQVPWAFVVTTDIASATPDDLDAHCRASLAAYKVPVRFVMVDALPRNEVGKVLRRNLVEAHR